MADFRIYYCTSIPGDLISTAVKWFLMVKECNRNPITHICVETQGIFFDYTGAGVSTFTLDQPEAFQELIRRTVFTQHIELPELAADDVYANAYELCDLPPMTLWNFLNPRKYICTDVFPLLIAPHIKPQNLTPLELFEIIQLTKEL